MSHSTLRAHQSALRHFTSYLANPDYGWDRGCEQRFGTHPAQVFYEWNTSTHVQEFEGRPSKRPFTSDGHRPAGRQYRLGTLAVTPCNRP